MFGTAIVFAQQKRTDDQRLMAKPNASTVGAKQKPLSPALIALVRCASGPAWATGGGGGSATTSVDEGQNFRRRRGTTSSAICARPSSHHAASAGRPFARSAVAPPTAPAACVLGLSTRVAAANRSFVTFSTNIPVNRRWWCHKIGLQPPWRRIFRRDHCGGAVASLGFLKAALGQANRLAFCRRYLHSKTSTLLRERRLGDDLDDMDDSRLCGVVASPLPVGLCGFSIASAGGQSIALAGRWQLAVGDGLMLVQSARSLTRGVDGRRGIRK